MRLWSNFVCFFKYRFFCVVAQVTSPVFLLSNVKLHALLVETAFPDALAALSDSVLFAPVKYYLSFASFRKKYLVRLQVLILQMQ